MSDHPGRLALERHSVEDLDAAAAASLEAHLADCASCRAIFAALAAEAEAHRAADPAPFIAAVRARRRGQRRRRRRLGVAAVTGLAAAAALLFALHHDGGDEAPPGDRFKGGAAVTVHRSRDGATAPLGAGDRVRAGDRLRIAVTLRAAARVAVWFIDDRGRIDPLAPAAIELDAGARLLPGAVEVEAPCRDSVVAVAIGEAAGLGPIDRATAESRADVAVVALPCEP